MRYLLCTLIVPFLLTGPPAIAAIGNGTASQRELSGGINDLIAKAHAGNTQAQFELGLHYLDGELVRRDVTKAAELIRSAATQNYPEAAATLGYMYMEGVGVENNPAEAIRWLTIDAEKNNNAWAQFNLATLYRRGEGTSVDYTQARHWYLKAAEQGYISAFENLGLIYERGLDVPQDYLEAFKWYMEAAEYGSVYGQYSVGYFFHLGLGVHKNYDEAMLWYQKAAAEGDPEALNEIGVMYHNGEGVAQDYAQAAQWYQRAVDAGNMVAAYNLGRLYYHGQGVAQDDARAFDLLMDAAAYGDASAQFYVGYMYQQGRGTGRDVEKASVWYQKSAAQGNPEAAGNLRAMKAGIKGATPQMPLPDNPGDAAQPSTIAIKK